jgi:hypothetical protein
MIKGGIDVTPCRVRNESPLIEDFW